MELGRPCGLNFPKHPCSLDCSAFYDETIHILAICSQGKYRKLKKTFCFLYFSLPPRPLMGFGAWNGRSVRAMVGPALCEIKYLACYLLELSIGLFYLQYLKNIFVRTISNTYIILSIRNIIHI